MDDPIGPLNRRTVLQRGVAFLAGVFGLQLAQHASEAQASTLLPQTAGSTEGSANAQLLRFFARDWQPGHHDRSPGKLPAASGRMNRQGELFETVGGAKYGEFFAVCFSPAAPYCKGTGTLAGVELHTFKLGADTLFGMGSFEPTATGAQLHAIAGGTGRFAGARGSYVVSKTSDQTNGNYTEIVIQLLTNNDIWHSTHS